MPASAGIVTLFCNCIHYKKQTKGTDSMFGGSWFLVMVGAGSMLGGTWFLVMVGADSMLEGS